MGDIDMEEVKCFFKLLLLLSAMLLVACTFLLISKTIVDKIELNTSEKKIEMLQEKGLLTEEAMEVLIQELQI